MKSLRSLFTTGLLALALSCDPGPPPPPVDGGSAPTFCGGIAGFTCPTGLVCVDDPRDDCDPRKGGADCGGICVKSPDSCQVRHLDPARDYKAHSARECQVIRFTCPAGSTAFFDDCGCGCVKG